MLTQRLLVACSSAPYSTPLADDAIRRADKPAVLAALEAMDRSSEVLVLVLMLMLLLPLLLTLLLLLRRTGSTRVLDR